METTGYCCVAHFNSITKWLVRGGDGGDGGVGKALEDCNRTGWLINY